MKLPVPKHRPLRVGTPSCIVNDITACLEIERQELVKELFG